MPKSSDKLRDLTGETNFYIDKSLNVGVPNTPAAQTTQNLYQTVLLKVKTSKDKEKERLERLATFERRKNPNAETDKTKSKPRRPVVEEQKLTHPVAISIYEPIQGLNAGLNTFSQETPGQNVLIYLLGMFNAFIVYLTTYAEFAARTGSALLLEPTKKLLDKTKDLSNAAKYSLRTLGFIVLSPLWCIGQTFSAAADAIDAARLTMDALIEFFYFSSLKIVGGNLAEGLARLAIPVTTIVGISYFHEMSNLLIQSETAEAFAMLYLLGAASATDKLVKAGVLYGQERLAERNQHSALKSPETRTRRLSGPQLSADALVAPVNSTKRISIQIEELKEHKEENEYKFMEVPNSPTLTPPAQPDPSDLIPNFPFEALSPRGSSSSSSGSSSDDENKPFLKVPTSNNRAASPSKKSKKGTPSTSRINMADMLFSNSPSPKSHASEYSNSSNPSTPKSSSSVRRLSFSRPDSEG